MYSYSSEAHSLHNPHLPLSPGPADRAGCPAAAAAAEGSAATAAAAEPEPTQHQHPLEHPAAADADDAAQQLAHPRQPSDAEHAQLRGTDAAAPEDALQAAGAVARGDHGPGGARAVREDVQAEEDQVG